MCHGRRSVTGAVRIPPIASACKMTMSDAPCAIVGFNAYFLLPMSLSTSAPSLCRLWPFVRPYRTQLALAILFLLMAAAATLVFPWSLRRVIDGGMAAGAKSEEHTSELQSH